MFMTWALHQTHSRLTGSVMLLSIMSAQLILAETQDRNGSILEMHLHPYQCIESIAEIMADSCDAM